MRNASMEMPKSCRIQPPATVKMSSVTRANSVESRATLSLRPPVHRTGEGDEDQGGGERVHYDDDRREAQQHKTQEVNHE